MDRSMSSGIRKILYGISEVVRLQKHVGLLSGRFKSRLLFSYYAPRQGFLAEMAALRAAISAKKPWRGAHESSLILKNCRKTFSTAQTGKTGTFDAVKCSCLSRLCCLSI